MQDTVLTVVVLAKLALFRILWKWGHKSIGPFWGRQERTERELAADAIKELFERARTKAEE